jgi:PST family polysaccharide transporter
MDLFWRLSLLNGAIQILAAFLSADVLTLCLFLFIGQILLSAVSYSICRSSLPTFNLFPIKRFGPILKLLLPFAALTILLVLIQRLGILFVSAILDDAATGLFSSITRVVDGLKLGHYAILGALLPALSSGNSASWNSFRKAFILLMAVSLFFSAILTFLASPIILLLYGKDFIQASSLLVLLGWSLLPYTISSFVSYSLIVLGYESDVVKSSLVSLFGNVILYLALIPFAGLRGAIWSALIGECLQASVFTVYYLRRITNL